jgi:hypothetical protein
MTVGMVWTTGVPSGTCMSMMRSVEVPTLHPQGPEDPRLPSAPEVVMSSPEDSSRAVRLESDPLWAIPTNMVSESHPWGEILRWPRQSTMNSRLLKSMVLLSARPTPMGLSSLAMNESFGGGTIGTSSRKRTLQIPLPGVLTVSVVCTSRI